MTGYVSQDNFEVPMFLGRQTFMRIDAAAPEFAKSILDQLGLEAACQACQMWERPHTPYHGPDHLIEGAAYINAAKNELQGWKPDPRFDALCLAWLFHDAVYDIQSRSNEELSARAMHQAFASAPKSRAFPADHCAVAERLILGTKDHNSMAFSTAWEGITEEARIMLEADLERLTTGDWRRSMDVESMIYREYGIYSWKDYRPGRVAVLSKLLDVVDYIRQGNNLRNVIRWLETWRPRIGLMVGSFNPFHVGHLELLERAEAIFDKVVVGVGVNPDKPNSHGDVDAIRTALANREVLTYEGLTTALVDSMSESGCDVTVVRGIRDAADLAFEKTLHRWNGLMSAGYKCVYIMPSAETEHISSSGIRSVLKSDPDNAIAKSYIVAAQKN